MLEELIQELISAQKSKNRSKIEKAYRKLERAGMDRQTATLVSWHRQRGEVAS